MLIIIKLLILFITGNGKNHHRKFQIQKTDNNYKKHSLTEKQFNEQRIEGCACLCSLPLPTKSNINLQIKIPKLVGSAAGISRQRQLNCDPLLIQPNDNILKKQL